MAACCSGETLKKKETCKINMTTLKNKPRYQMPSLKKTDVLFYYLNPAKIHLEERNLALQVYATGSTFICLTQDSTL